MLALWGLPDELARHVAGFGDAAAYASTICASRTHQRLCDDRVFEAIAMCRFPVLWHQRPHPPADIDIRDAYRRHARLEMNRRGPPRPYLPAASLADYSLTLEVRLQGRSVLVANGVRNDQDGPGSPGFIFPTPAGFSALLHDAIASEEDEGWPEEGEEPDPPTIELAQLSARVTCAKRLTGDVSLLYASDLDNRDRYYTNTNGAICCGSKRSRPTSTSARSSRASPRSIWASAMLSHACRYTTMARPATSESCSR